MFTRTEKEKEDLPWVEKYRPKSLKDIKGHGWIVDALTNFVSEKKIPHMIFTGPAGTGKTSSAVALTRDLLGEDFTPDKILELNASDNVRMDTVKKEIKNFTHTMSFSGKSDFKLIILDEADNIPKSPQQALRRIIEKSPSNIKFILMCNYENRLIDPIKSRCALFRFTPLPKDMIIERLNEIAKSEKLDFKVDFFNILYDISQGDMRKSVNLLQMASDLEINSSADYYKIFNVAGFLTPASLKELETIILSGNFTKAVEILRNNRGFTGRNILLQLMQWVFKTKSNLSQISRIIEGLAEFDYRITAGADIDLQIESTIAFVTQILSETK